MNQLTTAELNEIARQSMTENGFVTNFPPNVIKAVEQLKQSPPDFFNDASIRDLRSLLLHRAALFHLLRAAQFGREVDA